MRTADCDVKFDGFVNRLDVDVHSSNPIYAVTNLHNALFVVYDINDTTARWGSSAFDTAKEQGYNGTKDEYNEALSQVGAMQNVLDAILGEE
ncbi:hypothetical protein AGMMS49975_19040 [Clostridia bacterium]|nr:hypothetical protein AGMMS49975_19040 [Clostridia bacterium]